VKFFNKKCRNKGKKIDFIALIEIRDNMINICARDYKNDLSLPSPKRRGEIKVETVGIFNGFIN
jgi:hypothetical protein